MGGGTGRPRGDGSVWVEGGGWVMGCVWDGILFLSIFEQSKLRDGDPVQVQRIQERKKHRDGCNGVVRWYRTITGVGGMGGGWCWWMKQCGGGRLEACLVTYKLFGDFVDLVGRKSFKCVNFQQNVRFSRFSL